jgi:hypothetical protein
LNIDAATAATSKQEKFMSLSPIQGPKRSHRLSAAVGIVLALALTLLAAASPASAGQSRFVYELCDSAMPGGNPPVTSAPFPPGVAFSVSQNCAQPGGWVTFGQSGSVPLVAGQEVVSVPETPGGFVESETMTAEAQNLGTAAKQSWVAEYGWPTDGAGESRRSFYLRGEPTSVGNTGDFRMILGCEGTHPCPPGPTVSAHYIAATEVDPTPPTLTPLSGTLLAPGVARGHEEVSAEVGDIGGGVSKAEILVDGLAAASAITPACSVQRVSNPSYVGLAATSPEPCPSTIKASWLLDTSSSPFQEGSNTVQVCATDFATFGEPNRTCSETRTIIVNDSCTESVVSGGAVLTSKFAKSKQDAVTVGFGSAARVTGELVSQAGDPISGATICVQGATQGSSSGLRALGTATTDAHGHFVYSVSGGPNRELFLGYRHDSFQVAKTMHYYAHVRPSIRLSTPKVDNGGEIKITGRLPGGASAAGRVVVVKASALHSDKWFPFGEATTNGNGVFHYRYKFDATTRTTTYRMEAAVPKQDHYPYQGGHSRPALVEVRG